jgi:hypothetical protein
MVKVLDAATSLEIREATALNQLEAAGAFVTLYEKPTWLEADELLGRTEKTFVPGCCAVVVYSTDGRTRRQTGISAVQVWDDLKSWFAFIERQTDDAANRWEIAREPTSVVVAQRVSGDTAQQEERRRNTTRRVIQLDGDEHGDHSPGAATLLVEQR